MDGFIGEIRAFTWGYTPSGWLACDGATLVTQQYQALYSIIGQRFTPTSKQSSTTFCLPDLRGSAAMGFNVPPSQNGAFSSYPLGQTVGSNTATVNLSQTPEHNHVINALNGPSANPLSYYVQLPSSTTMFGHVYSGAIQGPSALVARAYQKAPAALDTTLAVTTLTAAGAAEPAAHENRQPFLALNFCICNDGLYPVNPD